MGKTVILIGARGFVGSQVLGAVLDKAKSNDYTVKALIREGSNASKVQALGNVQVVRGDMMDKASLETAFDGVDVVINTANGYGQGHPEIDTQGAKNVVDAVKSKEVGLYLYCSVLTADKATMVEHFHHKYQHEQYAKEEGVPFVALRPGAFLDQTDDYLGQGILRGDSFAISMWNKTVPISMILIYTPDLAQLFADAIELPAEAHGQAIDVGWTRPIAYQEVVSICATKLGDNRTIRCIGLARAFRFSIIYTVGWFSAFWAEMFKMFNYFDSGLYVTDPELTLQNKYFGKPPTPEDAIGRYLDKLMEKKKKMDQEADNTPPAAESK